MNSETRRKEEWTVGLQFFLSARLRTQPFAAASRAHPNICVPAMVANTQHLLDGIVWSLNDHLDWAVDAWPHIQNYLRDSSERFDEMVVQLNTALAVRQKQKDSHHSQATTAAAAGNTRVEREQMYNAHAAVQDVYLAFCVVDAILKGCTPISASSAALGEVASGQKRGSAGYVLKETIEKELPHLVCEYFPIFAALPEENAPVREAMEEYRFLFLGLLESWAVMHTLSPHTIRRLEEHIRYKLKNNREGEGDDDGAEDGGGSLHDSGERDGTQARTASRSAQLAVQQSLELLLRGTLRGSAAAQHTGGGAGRLKMPRSAEMAERNIKSFLGSIFPSRRQVGEQIRCPHCGAPFKDEKAKDAHYRYHFHNHNVMRGEEKVVRMSYPSQEDFMVHMGDLDQSGYFPKATEMLEEAYKNGEKGVLKARRLEDAARRRPALS